MQKAIFIEGPDDLTALNKELGGEWKVVQIAGQSVSSSYSCVYGGFLIILEKDVFLNENAE